ncbi:MAG: tRNA epoxyqueuosine(34) reductase QueG [Bacillota bacterium]|nr:tRNA epoxyqueuosine(34) reductase QueG [Bacillota bacterium]
MKKDLKDLKEKLNIDLLGIVEGKRLDLVGQRIVADQEAGFTTDFELEDLDLRIDPKTRLENVASIFVLAMSYFWGDSATGDYKISAYARGRDYHKVLSERISKLVDLLKEDFDFSYYSQVDAGGFYEKDLGRLAGFGSYGKNSLLINKDLGSYFFLGLLFTDIDIDNFSYDKEIDTRSCGSCKLCQEVCPTGAICGDYRVNFSKCLSYVSQSKKDSPYLKDLTYAYGCDLCQRVCPRNKNILSKLHQEFRPSMENFDQVDFENLSNKGFKRKFSDYAFAWTGKKVIERNIKILKSRS